MLPSYLDRVKNINEGATVDVLYFPRFTSSYVSLKQFRIAASFSRHLLFLDYAHFKGQLEGGVMSASAIDANDHIIVIAFSIVPDENHANWAEFLEHLKEEEEPEFRRWLQHEDVVAFIDRKPGLILAFQEQFEEEYNTHYV